MRDVREIGADASGRSSGRRAGIERRPSGSGVCESSPRHAAVVTVGDDGRLVDVEYAPLAEALTAAELSQEVQLAHASALARLSGDVERRAP
ncbi:hypothetical protein Bcav_1853 [Beutenbergia cavernae DSM 12333]|uniref:Uncharacterized protein n=1 Tax=Beutenbergia cavernae (strain ATCC BAA-8 / DSM 12333 / CCUG 43141 / JCM 11478 / NBRC 16432 / NCIMB 13614 / HKI 0122) TaxID=471853 RepID=C5C4Y1_BEUC1|nr:hypothetical protein Bcav_1853 [Beutenbergia cavernae DSM 12333]